MKTERVLYTIRTTYVGVSYHKYGRTWVARQIVSCQSTVKSSHIRGQKQYEDDEVEACSIFRK